MPVYLAPGVFVEELSTGARPIEAVNTTMAGFVGAAPKPDARPHQAVRVNGFQDMLGSPPYFRDIFVQDARRTTPLAQGVYNFFLNGGSSCYVVNTGSDEDPIGGDGRGLDLLSAVDEVAMIAAPGRTDLDSYGRLLGAAEALGDRVALLDGPATVEDVGALTRVAARGAAAGAEGAGLRAPASERGFGAFYFPWLVMIDPIVPEQGPVPMPPSGAVAGICARTDRLRGVHKAPAGVEAKFVGEPGVTQLVSRADQETLNPAGVNCIRAFSPEGIRLWGARTLAPSASEWRYLNVRRLFIMVEKSILRATRWTVFEPNDRPLWKSIRRDIEDFLTIVWRNGALMGATRDQAFFVKCDEQTNTRETIDAGMVVALVGLAAVKPAEFVVFRIGQSAAGATVEQV